MKRICVVLCLLSLCLSVVFAQDTNPPRVTLASVSSDVIAPATLFLAAVVSDDSGIARVDLFKADVKVAELTQSPFTFSVPVSAAEVGQLSFKAVAYDTSGNQTESATVAVNVSAAAGATPTATGTSFVAVDDTYSAIVNTWLKVGLATTSGLASTTSTQSLLANDAGVTAATTVISELVATSLGGLAILNDNGGFSYIGPLNTSGQTDSFSYTLTDGANSSEATVFINLEAVNNANVFYVKAGSANGNGSADAPFATLAEAQASSAAGDTIVLHSGAYASFADHHFSFKPNQRLLGQGSSVVLNGEVVLESSDAPLLLRTSGPNLLLASDVVVQGVRLSRANLSGTASADTNANSWSSGIYIPSEVTGAIRIENVSVAWAGAFGIVLANSGEAASLSSLSLIDVSVDHATVAGISVDDASEFSMSGGSVTNIAFNPDVPGSGRGILIEAGADSTVSLSNIRFSSVSDNSQALFIRKNTTEGQTSRLSVSMNQLSASFLDEGAEGATAFMLNHTGGATGPIELSGTGNETNALTPFYVIGDEGSASGVLNINGFDFP